MNGGSMPSPEALGGMINTLMSNPQLLKNIKDALGDIPLPNNNADEDSFVEDAEGSEKTENALVPGGEIMNKLPQLMSALGGSNKGKSNSEALLCALKPYLTRERAEKVDKLINLMRIGDILSGL